MMAVACSGAMADWKGHLTTFFDAQAACANMYSPECQPFLAEAVAVADVFQAIAKPEGTGITVAFENMRQENCSENWLQSMNGESLLHSALGLPVNSERAKNLYFSRALMMASRHLCHF
jgi:hypothetical protein